MASSIVYTAVLVTLAAPASLLAALGISSVLGRPLGEVSTGRLARASSLVAFVAAALGLVVHLGSGSEPWTASLGLWFGAGGHGFALDFLIDGVSLGFATLATALCGVDGAFSHRYLHREPGFNRYFVLYGLFTLGITLVALAGSVEVLFAGWEFLGLSSALLIGFFHERRAPVVNALRVFAVYRLSDAAMLAAAVLLHHWTGAGTLTQLFYGDRLELAATPASIIALLLLIAVVGKSGLLPLSGWLPRAMEGPTSSSAVFYGSLSIHAGCFLLLRVEPLLEHAPVVRALAIAAGLATAIHATLSARVQTDVKSALTYAALTQVGVIVVEIGLGLTTLALVHIVGHACYRMLQFLSAPNILHDLHELENALGEHVDAGARPGPWSGAGARWRRWVYLVALERGFLDALLDRLVVGPFVALASALDRLDHRLCGRERGDD
ncbi:MAG: proton-conducting transporter membrane subunit [Enhygromyxa sp.]